MRASITSTKLLPQATELLVAFIIVIWSSFNFLLLLKQECTDSLLDQLDQQLKITEDESKHYKESLERLTEAEKSGQSEEDLENELQKVRKVTVKAPVGTLNSAISNFQTWFVRTVMEVLKYCWMWETSNMQCNYNSFIQIINFHGLFCNALRCRKTGACQILVPLRYQHLFASLN